MKYYIIFCVLLINISANSQENLHGVVYGIDKNKSEILPFANVQWLDTDKGAVTNKDGKFHIIRSNKSKQLVVSYVGYKTDTIKIDDKQDDIKISLLSSILLNTIDISERKNLSYISKVDPIHVQHIDGGELKKAACCNLSESFETNASIDVNYADAVTGAKQIKLLGLDGKYSQIMTEKIPFVRGLTSMYGLTYIPGHWMESIQVSKGTATVENGYESITGQINVEYKKPDDGNKFYLNLLANDKGKTELNSNYRFALNDKWSSAILIHGENNQLQHDLNNDGFVDMPTLQQYNLINRWKYNSKNFKTQFGIKYLEEHRLGGQITYDKDKPNDLENGYSVNIETKNIQLFHKFGIIFNRQKTSIGFIQSAKLHDQSSVYGLRNYYGNQKSYYANLMFHTYMFNTNHNIRTGISFIHDDFTEKLDNENFSRIENVPGIFFQYTYLFEDKFAVIAGLRADFHNLFGLFYTPRLHLKYNFSDSFVIRGSAGKGFRTSCIFAENSYTLVSSRKITVMEKLLPEEAWNFGISASKDLLLFNRELTVNTEFYKTKFINQIIVDMETDVSSVLFYNLNGRSYSNSAQIELIFEPLERLDITTAFRRTDVKTTINDKFQQKPLVNQYKGLFTISYYTNLKKWQFDFTSQLNGNGILPSTEQNPVQYQKAESFDPYAIFNAQITKYFKRWDFYLGVENITDFTQDEPIIASDDPFGDYFDASMVWGPLTGRKFYIGLRYKIKTYK
ncbi:MAG: TonB-dependent receptor [Bacteroidales bacterium]|nr:TonB-dependent receptor [Bacteroidales bacterium]